MSSERPRLDQPRAPGLPLMCSGCGALSQTINPDQAGYYNLDKKATKAYLGLLKRPEKRVREDDKFIEDVLRSLEPSQMDKLGVNLEGLLPDPDATDPEPPPLAAPLCDRCHNLIHHHAGNPIFHPNVESLRETIEESPFQYNHVYHVLDAADFPMSLLPRIHQLLDLMPLRSQNRRAKSGRYFQGRKTEMSFIITRSDLLARKKEDVDSLMPYLKETLRVALGRAGRNVRLGNVRCVSAKRSWWTKELKEDIWERGGAGWMVGKVNVGKSQLFEAVFPKGRMDSEPKSKHHISVPVYPSPPQGPQPGVVGHGGSQSSMGSSGETSADSTLVDPTLDELSLLPPAQPETNYPAMPLVSSLPGTTASPIRVPFGGGKGELIDLPGITRSDLENYVREEHRSSLLMKSRIVPEQRSIKPGQSLLIGGFIRITPCTPDLIFLAYAFTPIKPHLTSTEKAIAIQAQTDEAPNVENIARPGTGESIKSAGRFELRWDVTKERTGPITRHDAANIKVDRLPYRVLAIDILIEGVGWVEVVAQARTRQLFAPKPKPDVREEKDPHTGEMLLQTLDLSKPEPEPEPEPEPKSKPEPTHPQGNEEEPNWPVIEVFTPEGKFIGSRSPMNAWLMNKPKPVTTKRPRRSMKGAKKRAKLEKRAEITAARAAARAAREASF